MRIQSLKNKYVKIYSVMKSDDDEYSMKIRWEHCSIKLKGENQTLRIDSQSLKHFLVQRCKHLWTLCPILEFSLDYCIGLISCVVW